MVVETLLRMKKIKRKYKAAMYHGENVLMILIKILKDSFLCRIYCVQPLEFRIKIEPNLFSFNSPKGACEHCNGLGTVNEINLKNYPNLIYL